MEKTKNSINRLKATGLLTEQQAQDLMQVAAKYIKTKGDSAVAWAIDSKLTSPKRNPAAYMSVVLPGLPNAKAPEPEPLPEPEVDPVDEIERELTNEETDRREWEKWAEGLSQEEMADLLRGDAYRVEDRRPLLACSLWNQTPELYAENTWATVHRKAREAGTSMHEVCRQIGIRYQHVIFKGFGQE